jgi:hypothetical protein
MRKIKVEVALIRNNQVRTSLFQTVSPFTFIQAYIEPDAHQSAAAGMGMQQPSDIPKILSEVFNPGIHTPHLVPPHMTHPENQATTPRMPHTSAYPLQPL